MTHLRLIIEIIGSLVVGLLAFRACWTGSCELDCEHWPQAQSGFRRGLLLGSANLTLAVPPWFWAHRPWLATVTMSLAALGTVLALHLANMGWLAFHESGISLWSHRQKH